MIKKFFDCIKEFECRTVKLSVMSNKEVRDTGEAKFKTDFDGHPVDTRWTSSGQISGHPLDTNFSV